VRAIQTSISGSMLVAPHLFADSRGYFLETWQTRSYSAADLPFSFVQDNCSSSQRNVLRGLHYQIGHAAQGKLVWVSSGIVFDVVVDLRRSSPSFGKWEGHRLSADTHQQLWIPAGCAHGFLALTESTMFHYKCTNFYDPASERTLLWNDPDLAIDWPLFENLPPIVSERDRAGLPFSTCAKFD
jgi:dTDP-4-dehydrorhamnose 3,5-epimerase